MNRRKLSARFLSLRTNEGDGKGGFPFHMRQLDLDNNKRVFYEQVTAIKLRSLFMVFGFALASCDASRSPPGF